MFKKGDLLSPRLPPKQTKSALLKDLDASAVSPAPLAAYIKAGRATETSGSGTPSSTSK